MPVDSAHAYRRGRTDMRRLICIFSGWTAILSYLLWFVYLVLPVDGWGLFPGRPLALLATTVLLLSIWAMLTRPPRRFWPVLVVAIVAKLALGWLLVPRGF